MLMRLRIFLSRIFLICSLALLVLMIVAWGETYSPSYQNCVADYGSQKCQSEGTNLNFMRGSLPLILRCEGTSVNQNNGTLSAFATILLAFITGWLVLVARDQSKTTRARLRAYVFARSYVEAVKGNKTTCECILNNSGTTPAYTVEYCIDAWIDTCPNPTETRVKKFGRPMCIGPGDEISVLNEIEVSDADMEEIRAENKAIWVTASISYADTFGSKWKTKVNFFMTGNNIENIRERRMTIENYQAT